MITNLADFTLTADKINEILEGVLGNNRPFKVVSTERSPDYQGEKSQGETGEGFDVYDIGQDPVYLKVSKSIDSYGDNEEITGIKLVLSQQKTKTVYE